MSEPTMVLRAVRHKTTGKVTTQSSNKTKRLLKSGDYVECPIPGSNVIVKPLPPVGAAKRRAKRRPYIWATLVVIAAAVAAAAIIWAKH